MTGAQTVLGLDVDASEAAALGDVKGISGPEVQRIVAARPFESLADFWHRVQVSRHVVERLVLVGALDSVCGIAPGSERVRRRGRVTRRDLLLQVAELDRHHHHQHRRSAGVSRAGSRPRERHPLAEAGVWAQESAQSQPMAPLVAIDSVQLTLGFGDGLGNGLGNGAGEGEVSGLPEMTSQERTQAALEILQENSVASTAGPGCTG